MVPQQSRSDPAQSGPFDGQTTHSRVLNSSNNTVTRFPLSSDTDIFGFDGDGACIAPSGTYSPQPSASQCLGGSYQGSDPEITESAGATFSGISADLTTGTVNVRFGPRSVDLVLARRGVGHTDITTGTAHGPSGVPSPLPSRCSHGLCDSAFFAGLANRKQPKPVSRRAGNSGLARLDCLFFVTTLSPPSYFRYPYLYPTRRTHAPTTKRRSTRHPVSQGSNS